MTTYSITIDAREKTPLPLPASLLITDFNQLPQHQRTRRVFLTSAKKRLATADYLLAGESGIVYDEGHTVVVETKRSLSEIAHNVLDPHARRNFIALLGRMSSHTPRAFLVVEGGLRTLHDPGPNPSYDPICGLDQFLDLCLRHRVHPWLIDGGSVESRRRAADFVARLLILGGMPRGHPDSHPQPATPATSGV